MSRPSTDTLHRGGVINIQMHELQPRNHLTQALAVSALERRAGQHEAFTCGLRALNLLAQCIQPVATVFVAQRVVRAHALYVFGRMEMIGFDMAPTECGGDPWLISLLPEPLTPMTTRVVRAANAQDCCCMGTPWAPSRWRRSLFDPNVSATQIIRQPYFGNIS